MRGASTGVVLLAIACSSSIEREPSSSEPAARATTTASVIAVIALKNERLTIRASGDGPRFDVTAADGRALSRDLDLAALALRHSELYQLYRSSYARASDDEPFLDARAW